MTHWNHRVVYDPKTCIYAVHEIYYNEKDELEMWTEEPVTPIGETAKELKEELRMFLRAFKHPVLEMRETLRNDEPFGVELVEKTSGRCIL